jgi:hypothetical protein
MQSASFTAPVTEPTLDDTWQRMKPKITAWRLQHHPELVEMAMNLVFQIERETVASCEMPSGTDTAMLRRFFNQHRHSEALLQVVASLDSVLSTGARWSADRLDCRSWRTAGNGRRVRGYR